MVMREVLLKVVIVYEQTQQSKIDSWFMCVMLKNIEFSFLPYCFDRSQILKIDYTVSTLLLIQCCFFIVQYFETCQCYSIIFKVFVIFFNDFSCLNINLSNLAHFLVMLSLFDIMVIHIIIIVYLLLDDLISKPTFFPCLTGKEMKMQCFSALCT